MRGMEAGPQMSTSDTVLDVVTDLLESEGYDAVQVRTVAKQARISLATLYKFFPTRNELVVEALVRWMERNVYSGIVRPAPEASLYDGLLSLYRQLFQPWERNPRMLEAYHRARAGPGGRRLDDQGLAVMEPMSSALLGRVDRAYAEDVGIILTHMFYALISEFADGKLSVTEIVPVLERTLHRLTADNVSAAKTAP